MERTEETLKARVRETPLHDRLNECRKRIGNMCAEGRAPRMCIPVQHSDDDFFICTTLADAQAQIESLQRERNEAEERAEQCRKDRAMVLNVKTTDGLTASEWLMRTVVAEQKAKDLHAALDAEREKVKGLHEATKVICGHCCESMEIPSKAVLQTQLTQLQALVRALPVVETELSDKARSVHITATIRINGEIYGVVDPLKALLEYRRTLPATPTEEAT